MNTVVVDTLIWDGIEFRHVTREEAAKLESEDKAQILSDGFIDGLSLKFRQDFKGYQTREMRAAEESSDVDYSDNTVAELKDMAKSRGLENFSGMLKKDLIELLEQDDMSES